MDINNKEILNKSMTEFRIQVDRKRLEEMIIGEIHEENAETFFNRIEQITEVKIYWPAKLKIKAKTKKDVIIKLIGNSLNIQNASKLIEERLKIKKEKVILKMEISHNLHSQIIGKSGKNTKQIMKDTCCHIHFPDSNKILNPIIPNSKNDQVSISGFIKDVEKAREMLRASIPLTINVNIQLSLNRSLHSIQPRLDPVNLQRHFPSSSSSSSINNNDLSIQFIQNNFGSLHFIMRSSTKNELEMLKAFGKICQLIGIFPTGEELFYGLLLGLLISGQIEGIFVARKFITGLLPIILQFEKSNNKLINQSNNFLKILENELDLQIFEKRKKNFKTKKFKINENEGGINNLNEEKEYIISTYEANLFNAYLARNQFSEKFKEEIDSSNEQFPLDNDKAALMRSLCRESLLAYQLSLPPSSVLKLSFNDNINILQNNNKIELNNNLLENKLNCNEIILEKEENKLLPDPQESPIAAGLLAGAKSINLQKGEFRKILDNEPIFGQFQENNNNKKLNEISKINSNDIFAIYGFSNSLPTELFCSKNIWKDEENKQLKGRPIVGRGNEEKEIKEKNNKEKEFSTIIFNKNISSELSTNISNNKEEEGKNEEEINNKKIIEIKKATALVHPRVAALQASEQLKRNNSKFTMSAGNSYEINNLSNFKINNENKLFKEEEEEEKQQQKQQSLIISPPISFKWDIRILNEPSIILKQLGIRKKIMHAITKLRESANLYGIYSL
ncbi:hypothetical protein Mgra_00001819 [Meloidogyne graminicola]|uniref:K Homology domain-containing protein n=1 Tax=Meloidogyne graminicola TaxID=189291 RepID=A0A8S9ZZN2_9BILA|nr:hypothetical protein Mgra_00001819 [Meloidogyne graminicola]